MTVRAAARLLFVVAGLAACAGEIDPSLIPGALGQGGSGGGAPPCDAPQMVFAPRCAVAGCPRRGHRERSRSRSRIGRLGRSPPRPGAVDQHDRPAALCTDAGKPYLVAGSNPATGLLIDKTNSAAVSCGSSMALLGQLTATQLTCLTAWATAVTTGAITQ
jgi:hypothetical protein